MLLDGCDNRGVGPLHVWQTDRTDRCSIRGSESSDRGALGYGAPFNEAFSTIAEWRLSGQALPAPTTPDIGDLFDRYENSRGLRRRRSAAVTNRADDRRA